MAVVLVVLSHLTGWPAGGFIGVDVFFVISGFLITGLLLREHARTGRISFPDFYRRRIRRIVPVATIVLVTTVIASYMIFFGSKARETLYDALWSSVFAANARFALLGTDYQHAGAAVSPLQHFWSLAVEEQFYVFWPLLLVAVLALTKRALPTTARFGLPVLVVAVTLGSFAWAVWETSNDPTVAYFSTASRAWELGTGAALAVFSTQLQSLSTGARRWLAWTGLTGIVISALLIDAGSPFPAPWALAPVLATAAVIAAGTGKQAPRLALLDNGPMAYLGNISYSLYLWHWPVIVLAGSLLPRGDVTSLAVIVSVILGLSVLSYHFVEDPIRRSTWLDPSAGTRSASRTSLFPRQAEVAGVLAICLVTTAMASYALLRDPSPAGATSAPALPLNGGEGVSDLRADTAPGSDIDPAQLQLDVAISAALASTSWPDLSPSLESLPEHKVPEWVEDGCLGLERQAQKDPQANAARCVYGAPDAAHTAVLLGDSVAISYLPGIRAALEPLGWKIHVYTLAECPALTATVLRGDDSAHPACDGFRDWALNDIAGHSPDLTIMSSAANSLNRFLAIDEREPIAQWRAGTDATLDRLVDSSARTVVLSPPPGSQRLQDCATRSGTPWDCVLQIGPTRSRLVQQELEAAQTHGATVSAVDTKRWFCSADESCPAFIGTTPVYTDGSHLTAEYSRQLAPLLEPVLLGATTGL